MPPLCRTKHNRAKPMFELPSAIFLIADGNEFRFARFYIVCEEVPLGTPESPLIVCGLSDTLRECPNVEETQNSMQTFSWKKCSHFSQPNFHLHFHMKSPNVFLIISLIKARYAYCGNLSSCTFCLIKDLIVLPSCEGSLPHRRSRLSARQKAPS